MDEISLDLPVAPGVDLLQRVPLFRTFGFNENLELSGICHIERKADGAVILVSTESIKEFIVDPGRTHENSDYLAKNRDVYGTLSFDQHLAELYRNGQVALDVAKAAASSPSDFERALYFE